MKRVILMVTDSVGIGELPDAANYDDTGANTLGHIRESMDDFNVPNLKKLGMTNIDGVFNGDEKEEMPEGSFGKFGEKSIGKDTITGHWEIAGIETKVPFKTYPEGFPEDFIKAFEAEIGRECIGNYPESGTVIIEKLGPEHEATGKPIVYTSSDSVFQIAANVDVIPLEELYEMCRKARGLLKGQWACGRVIARPYKITCGKRVRTSDRRDYAVSPPEDTVLDKIAKAGMRVHAVGKISDIFNGKGITSAVHTEDNMDGTDKTIEAMKETFDGLIFTNLVDFDSKFGHRRDPIGYGKAIMEFDSRIPEIREAMNDGDILMICADHGNDPVHRGFDHTREYIPFLIYGKKIRAGVNIGVGNTFADIGATICQYLGVAGTGLGTGFLSRVIAEEE